MKDVIRSQRRDRREISTTIPNWVTVDDECMPVDEAAHYKRRKQAIELYSSGASLKQITEETGVVAKDLYRFLDRCEATNSDGRMNGWRGIIPRAHVMPRRLSSDDPSTRLGYANEFTRLLASHPNIRDDLISLALKGWRVGEKGPKRRLTTKAIAKTFIEDCRNDGITVRDYPLKTDSQGYGALRRFVNRVRSVSRSGSYPVGGISELLPTHRCYQRAQGDGHWKDLICTVELPSPTSRGVLFLPIQRLWLITLIESVSTAVLGYSIAYGSNYSGADLIRAVRSSVLPWSSPTGLTYSRGEGFPTGVDEDLSYVCYDELFLDNHRGHLSIETVSQLHRTLGATPVYGSIDNQNMRAGIEGFFNQIEQELHQLVSTTGSHPNNMPVANPEKNAVKYAITDEKIHAIAEQFLARYNSESPPGSSLSRIEILQRYVHDPRSLVRRIPVEAREKIDLYDIVLDLEVKGNEAQSIKPYLYWQGSNYTNTILSTNYALIGSTLRCYGNSGDIRILQAYFSSGADAGQVICEPRFRQTPHSLTTRKYANSSRRAGLHKQNHDGDDIAGYRDSIRNGC